MPARQCSSQLCCYLLVFQPGSDILSVLCSGNILNHHDTVEISHESSGCGQCLLEYLLERLQVESCHVKLKVRTALLFKFLSVIWHCEMELCPVAIMDEVWNVADFPPFVSNSRFFFMLLVFQVLKIFVHLCGHGSNHFLTELRRNSTFIQQASG